jgi:hypothetical protein
VNRFYKIICFLLIIAPLARVAAQYDKQPDDSSQVEYQDIAERARQRYKAIFWAANQGTAQYAEYEEKRRDYYAGLREKYNTLPDLSRESYDFLEKILPRIEAGEDPQTELERIKEAAFYANSFWVPLEETYQNLDEYREKWRERQREFDARVKSDRVREIVIIVGICLVIIFSVIGFTLLKKELKKKPFKFPKIGLNTGRKNITRNADDLLKYHTLLKEGAITQEEFEKIKNELLKNYKQKNMEGLV